LDHPLDWESYWARHRSALWVLIPQLRGGEPHKIWYGDPLLGVLGGVAAAMGLRVDRDDPPLCAPSLRHFAQARRFRVAPTEIHFSGNRVIIVHNPRRLPDGPTVRDYRRRIASGRESEAPTNPFTSMVD